MTDYIIEKQYRVLLNMLSRRVPLSLPCIAQFRWRVYHITRVILKIETRLGDSYSQ